jgi:hypothetical protein
MFRCCAKTIKNRRCLNKKNDSDYCHIHKDLIPECSICYEPILRSDKYVLDNCKYVLDNCNHSFHYNCVNTWLLTKDNCPLCRTVITDQEYLTCIEHAINKKILVSINVYSYSISELELQDQLDFLEYINVFFLDITYCDIYTWNIIIDYIQASPEIYKIFKKIIVRSSIKFFKKESLDKFFNSNRVLSSIYCFER